MTTTVIKRNLHKMIDNIEDNIILNAVYAILAKFSSKGKAKDMWDELSAGQKAEIEEAIAELDRGEGIPHEEVMSKYKGKYI
jgi:hypothetical protein